MHETIWINIWTRKWLYKNLISRYIYKVENIRTSDYKALLRILRQPFIMRWLIDLYQDLRSCNKRSSEIMHNWCAETFIKPNFLFSFSCSHEGMSTGAGDEGGGGVGGVQSSGGGRNTPPHGSPTPMDKATLKVHLPNGKLFHHETPRQRTLCVRRENEGISWRDTLAFC